MNYLSLNKLQKFQDKATLFLIMGLVIAIPINPSFRSIFLVASLLFILFTVKKQYPLSVIFKKPLAWFCIAFFILALLGCFWGEALFSEKMMILEKYSKFLFFPILIAGFTSKAFRYNALNAYLLVMLGVAFLSFLKWMNILHCSDLDQGAVFYNHIITGLMMSYAAYISAWFILKKRFPFFYGLLWALFSFQIFFIGTGRMSYIIYSVLMGVFFLQILPLRKAFIALLGLSALLGIVYHQSATIKTATSRVVYDLKAYEHNEKATSVGYRLSFYAFSKELATRHPFLGNGTAGFTHAFSVEKPTPTWDGILLEPHNQYWLILVEFGLLGIAVLCLFLYFLIREIIQLKDMRILATGLLVAFLVGNLTDSLFFYSTTGLFFITMMALCLGENYMNPSSTPRQALSA